MVDYRDIEIKAKELSKKNNVDYYEMLQRFMFERIPISKYKLL